MPWRIRLRSVDDRVIPRAPATISSEAPPILAKSEYWAGKRCHFRIEQHVRKPFLQDAIVPERLLEMGLWCAHVQQDFVDVADDDARQGGHGLARSRSRNHLEARVRVAEKRPTQRATSDGRRLQKSTDALIFTKRGCRTLFGRSHVVVWGEKVWLYVRTALELAML